MPTSTRRGFAYKSSRSPYSKPKPQRKPRGRGQYINPERFVRVATPKDSESHEIKHKFSDFALDKRLQQNIARKGYDTPTPFKTKLSHLGWPGKTS